MIEIVAGDVTKNSRDGAHHLTVPPQLGVAPVLTGKSLLVEAYHPKKEVLRGVFAVNALQLLGAVRLQVEQWIHEALLLVLMRSNFRLHNTGTGRLHQL